MALNELIKQSVCKPGLYGYFAPSYRQAKSIAWTRLKQLLKVDESWKYNEQELSAYHPQIDTKIELKGCDNEDSLRGIGLNGAVLDEAAMIKANVWPEIIRPMLADKQGWALFITTPKGRNWVWDLFNNPDNRWESWQHSTLVNSYIAEDEVKQAKIDMSERLFKQEFLAEFLDDETGVFKGVNRCVTGDLVSPVTGRFYVMGVDLAKTEDFSVLTVIDSVTRHVVFYDRFQDISWAEQKLRIQKWAAVYNNAMCIVDSTGLGDPITEDLQKAGVSVDGYKFTNESKHRLIDQLAIAVEQRMITFPAKCEHLIEELKAYEYMLTPGGHIKYSAPSGKHDDCVISLALAVWAIRHQLQEAQVVSKQLDYQFTLDKQGLGERVVEEEFEEAIGGY